MIQIDDKIVSTDLLTEKFCCDPSRCKGACCVEGNAGAPLEPKRSKSSNANTKPTNPT